MPGGRPLGSAAPKMPVIRIRGGQDGQTESRRFTRALVDLAGQGLRAPCSDSATSYLWLSNSKEERAHAARLCGDCPVISECGAAAAARDEAFATWAGRDVTKPGYSGLGGGDHRVGRGKIVKFLEGEARDMNGSP
jgi:hypothetical protein